MPIPQHQILMGVGIAAVCCTSLAKHRWLLANTRKGQALVKRCGETAARYILWLLCLTGMAFGSLLASGVVRPIHW
jgi:hypothetical protein